MLRTVMFTATMSFLSSALAFADYDPLHPYVFYEGNNCTQKRLFSHPAGFTYNACSSYPSHCYGNNDEARSVMIDFDRLGVTGAVVHELTVYDSPSQNPDKDITRIQIWGRPAKRSTYCVSTFNQTKSESFLTITKIRGRTDDGKIDGKISAVGTTYFFK